MKPPVHIARANTWRDNLNPQRGLTIARAVSLVESYTRGEFADLMWTFGAPFAGIECSDGDLSALIELRTGALLEMDWSARPINLPDGPPEKIWLAEEQAEFIRGLMDGVPNLYDAFEHLAMATFRGFSHLEIVPVPDVPGAVELRPVDQWFVVRDGSAGPWRYNPSAKQVSYKSLSQEYDIDPARWIIREVKRPVGRIALIKWIRENLSQKDWDAFVEIYGIPGGVVTLPDNIPQGKETEYLDLADNVSRGGNGVLPPGGSWSANTQARGTSPFEQHLKWLQAKLVLAGTGGKLTMLAESGSGTLAGSAHAETFKKIAAGEARKIGELLQRQFVEPRLKEAFPGEDVLAWFEWNFQEETDVGEYIKDVAALSAAGYRVTPEAIREKTGYQVTSEPKGPVFQNRSRINSKALSGKNRTEYRPPYKNENAMGYSDYAMGPREQELSDFAAEAEKLLDGAVLDAMPDLEQRLETLLAIEDPEAFASALREMADDLLPLLAADTTQADAWERILSAALAEGLADTSPRN